MARQLNIVVKSQSGNVIPNSPVACSSSDETKAVVNDAGLVAGVAPGTFQITVQSLVNPSLIKVVNGETVAEVPTLSGVTVTPTNATIAPFQMLQLQAAGRDQFNNVIPGTALLYSSSNPAIATVDSNGLVTGVANGNVVITITAADATNFTATVNITVGSVVMPSPQVGDTLIMDTRAGGAQSIQASGVITRADALAAMGATALSDQRFIANFDGSNRKAFAINYTQAGTCGIVNKAITKTSLGGSVSHMFVQWKQRLGKTAQDGSGLGANGSFTNYNSACGSGGNAGRIPLVIASASDTDSVKFVYDGPLGNQSAFRQDQNSLYVQTAGPLPNTQVAKEVTHLIEIKAASGPTTADGILRYWTTMDGITTKNLERTDLPLGDEVFNNVQYSPEFNSPAQNQTEYLWDFVIWSPATTGDLGPNGEYIMGSNGTVPFFWESAQALANDTAFRAKIARYEASGNASWVYNNPAYNGSNTSGNAKYNDGRYVDLIRRSTLNGRPVFELRIPGANGGGSSPTPMLYNYPSSTFRGGWAAKRVAFAPNFTNEGNATSSQGIAFNATQASGYKRGFYFLNSSGAGRAGLSSVYSYYVVDFPSPANEYVGASRGTEYADGLFYDEVTYTEGFTLGGVPYHAVTVWLKPEGAPVESFVQISQRFCKANSGGNQFNFNLLCPTGLNYNMSRSTDIYLYQSDWAAWDQDDDPFDLAAYNRTRVPQYASIGADDSTSSAIPAFVSLTNIRPTGGKLGDVGCRVNGNNALKFYADLPRNMENNVERRIEIPSSLTTGTYTVEYFTRSADGLTESAYTTPISVNIVTTPLVAPNAPTAGNATEQTVSSLRFSVTLANTGGLPTNILYRAGTTDGVWPITGTIPLVGPGIQLGAVIPVQISGLTDTTSYFVQFASSNTAGTSAYTVSKTGTTSTPAPTAAAPLTSVGNGFIRGTNFSNSGIITGENVIAELQAIFGTTGTGLPATVNVSTVADPVFDKVARFAMPVGNFYNLLADNSLANIRLRMVFQLEGTDAESFTYRDFLTLLNDGDDPYGFGNPKFTLTESGGGTDQLVVSGIAADWQVAWGDTEFTSWLIAEERVEIILEWLNNDNNTYTINAYRNIVGAPRTNVLTYTTTTGQYISNIAPIWNRFTIMNPFTPGTAMYLAAIEVCDPYDGSGNLIPISSLGT